MDHQFAISEEKAVGFDFPGRLLNFLLLFFAQIRQIVNKLPTICGVRNHESELKRKFANALVAEVVPLDHFHVLDRLGAYAEVHRQAYSFQLEKVRPQVVLDQTLRRVVVLYKSVVFHIIFWHLH